MKAQGAHQSQQGQAALSLVPNWPLVALPTAFSLSNISSLSAALIAVCLVAAASVLAGHSANGRLSLTVGSLVLALGGLAVALRPNPPQTMGTAIFYGVVCATTALVVRRSHSRSSAAVSLVDGVGVLLAVAVLLRLAGVDGAGNAPVVMDNFLTGGERVVFPLLGALTSGPVLAAGYLVASSPIMRRTSQYRAYRLIAAAAALYVLVQGDRRSALFSVVVLVAMVTLTPRLLQKVAPWIIAFCLAAPFVLSLTGGLTRQVNLSQFQRTGEQNSEALNDRLQIWSRSIEFYQDRIDWFHQAFGFGSSGHAVSGASLTYRSFFAGTADSAARSPHNSVLQALFDGGWILASGLVITIFCLALVMSRRNSTFDLATLAMLTLLSIVGSTETLLTPGYAQPVWFTLVALGMIGFAQEDAVKRSSSPETHYLCYSYSRSGARGPAGSRRLIDGPDVA